MDTYALNKTSGNPLLALNNPDGSSTLVVFSDPGIIWLSRIPNGFASTTTTPGAAQTLLTYTVPAGETHYITQANVSCRIEGVAFLLKNGNPVSSARTSAASPNASLAQFPASEVAAAGDVIAISFTARLNSAPSSVECKLGGFIHV